jgi:uncharacterized membrane protein YqgA involved in biofilm formation
MSQVREVVRTLRPLAALVALDWMTRIIAWTLLPLDEPVRDDAVLQFVLRINDVGLGTHARALFDRHRHDFLIGAFGYIACGITLIWVRRLERKLLIKTALCLGAFFGAAVLVQISLPLFTDWSIEAIVFTLRASQTFFWVTVWFLVSARVWKLGCLLLAEAATANFVPPLGRVDFVYSRAISDAFGFGVFNLADALFLAAFPVFAIAALDSFIRRALRRTTSAPSASSSVGRFFE